MDNFITVTENQYTDFLGWYDKNFGGYYYEAVTPSDRTNVYNDKEDRRLIAYREYGGEPAYYHVNKSEWNYMNKMLEQGIEIKTIEYIGVSAEDMDKFNTWYEKKVLFPYRVKSHARSCLYDDKGRVITFTLFSPSMSDDDFYYIDKEYIKHYNHEIEEKIVG
jgi:hypothetical protein